MTHHSATESAVDGAFPGHSWFELAVLKAFQVGDLGRGGQWSDSIFIHFIHGCRDVFSAIEHNCGRLDRQMHADTRVPCNAAPPGAPSNAEGV